MKGQLKKRDGMIEEKRGKSTKKQKGKVTE